MEEQVAKPKPKPTRYNQRMIEDEPKIQDIVSASLIFGEENVADIAVYCPNCREVHGPNSVVVEYLNWISAMGIINFN